MIEVTAERRRRFIHHSLPAIGGMALVALVAGAMVGSLTASEAERVARDFARAWERGDHGAMHRLLTPEAQSRFGPAALRRAYGSAAATATAVRIEAGDPGGEKGGKVPLPVAVRTRLFGVVRGEVRLPIEEDAVAWAPHLVFPGIGERERLRRRSRPPRRAKLLARDGSTLAEGPADARGSPLGELAGSIAGRLEPPRSRGRRRALYARGFPRDWPVGQTGLERAFEPELAGRPGGELVAGGRVLARARPRSARPLRTTIDVTLQQASVAALAGRFGGIAVLDARTAEVRALAGIAFSAPQPPGSTFKLVTSAAALEAGLVEPTDRFPVETRAVIDGVPLENANGEACGGTFRNSFAHSCNSVFAPLGVKVGAKRLVAAAERFGFNERPTIPGARRGTLPPASEIRSPLEVGSTAIGQGKVLTTPLGMASIAQALASGGVRTRPTLRRGERRPPVRATTRRVARTLAQLMVDVVAYGTGTAATLPGVKVAGKTGTAELEDTRGPNVREQEDDASNTDAWFTAYAPVDEPQIAVAVLLVRAGAGGQTAAPAARVVLDAAF